MSPEWKLVTAFALAAVITLAATGTGLSLGHKGQYLAVFPLLAGATAIYRYWRPAPRLGDLIGATLKILLILLLGVLISFAAAALGSQFPYRDAWLQSADAAIGFNQKDYVTFILQHPLFTHALDIAYASLQPQFLLVGAALAVAGQRERLKSYTLAIGVTLAATLVIFVFMPARANGGGSWLAALDYMRSAGSHRISFDDLNGIVTFPSYHTQAACLFIWACWRLPYVRWPVLGLNSVLIAATPFDGAHYAVDVVAGMLIAITVLLCCRRWSSRSRVVDSVSEKIDFRPARLTRRVS